MEVAVIICFNCSRETKDQLEDMLRRGNYRDYNEVLATAVSNLTTLHDQLGKQGSLVLDSQNLSEGKIGEFSIQANEKGSNSAVITHTKASDRKPHPQTATEDENIPELFRYVLTDSVPEFVAPSSEKFETDKQIPIDKWIFGQFNRLLPAKVACRAIANLLISENRTLDIEKISLEIAEHAAILGDLLRRIDKHNAVGRDDALATAFPSIGSGAEKSRIRFANQFVGSLDKDGQLLGLLADLKLVNVIYETESTQLRLTRVGWDFACLRNPILDSSSSSSTARFSTDESNLLLNHINNAVPIEKFAYKSILVAIAQGVNTPDSLDNALKEFVITNRDRSLSDSFLSSQRSGAISRMADIGLVSRVRHGTRVSYVVTPLGEDWLKKIK